MRFSQGRKDPQSMRNETKTTIDDRLEALTQSVEILTKDVHEMQETIDLQRQTLDAMAMVLREIVDHLKASA
jgi:CHASE3 domain sensor protein